MIFVRPLVLIALIQILIQTNKPFCAPGFMGRLRRSLDCFSGAGLKGLGRGVGLRLYCRVFTSGCWTGLTAGYGFGLLPWAGW